MPGRNGATMGTKLSCPPLPERSNDPEN